MKEAFAAKQLLNPACQVFVCEPGSFGVAGILHVCFYFIPKLFNSVLAGLSLFRFKQNLVHAASCALNVYKPFHLWLEGSVSSGKEVFVDY